MKKSGLMNLLEQLRLENEAKPASETELTPLRLVDLLLDYINDPQIREAVDEINF